MALVDPQYSISVRLPFDSNALQSMKSVDVSSGTESPDLEYIVAPVAFISHGFIVPKPRANVCTIVGN